MDKRIDYETIFIEIVSCITRSAESSLALSPGLLTSFSLSSPLLKFVSLEPSAAWKDLCIRHFGSVSIINRSTGFQALYRSLLKERISFLRWRTGSYLEQTCAPNFKRLVDDSSPHQAVALASDLFFSKIHTTFHKVDPGHYALMARLSIESVCGLSMTAKILFCDHKGRAVGAPVFRSWPSHKWNELQRNHGSSKWLEMVVVEFEVLEDSPTVEVSLRNLDVCPHSSLKLDTAWLRKLN